MLKIKDLIIIFRFEGTLLFGIKYFRSKAIILDLNDEIKIMNNN